MGQRLLKIGIELDDARVRDAFNRLLKAGSDMSDLMGDIGEDLLNTTRERFNDEQDPDDRPWRPLSAVTLARKKTNRDKVLTERGHLRGAINYRAGRSHVDIGSSRIHASTHQFGAKKGAFGATKRGAPIPWGDIPARPFLGLSDDDRETILETVND